MSAFTILWEKSLNYLEEDLSLTQFVWVKDLKPAYAEEDVYYFEVPSPMHKNIITEKYLDKITQTIRSSYEELYGTENDSFELAFVTPQELHELHHMDEETLTIPDTAPARSNLNPNHTFDTFVVGESNKFANAAAHAVAASPGQAYNPLFLYGGVGLGKTHLMQAIGNRILQDNPSSNIVYVTSETFTNELIDMIQRTNNNANIDMREQFRNKYRKVDVLMIDDIQFIAGKTSSQEEFFHTFNALHEINKQIIITSDRPPAEIEKLEERMRSRFEWGLIADIKTPDYETRVAILRKKAQVMRQKDMLPIKDEVFHYIAEQKNTNIRTLEGALQRVMMYAELHKDPSLPLEIDLKMAIDALDGYFPPPHKKINPKLVADAVCSYYGITEEDIRGQKKNRDIALPRQIAMYILRDVTDISYAKIAEFFGKKDHTTIMHAEKKIKGDIKKDPSMKKEVEDIIAKIKG
ncbi:chromosomal replication initiator protein DnaA [Christensenellaceae bacterium OttesenSCG-928-K19]|nr:chromosomal replication initiator protein DnaA [Christensenellaceae bacterium OttesenSCG-928-K19]